MARCKLQALKCKFSPNEAEERLIEQVIVGTNLSELQKELLGCDEKLTLEQALNIIWRTYEASISHMSQLQGVQTRQTGRYTLCQSRRKNNMLFLRRISSKKRNVPSAYSTVCKHCGGKKTHWQLACRKSTHTKHNHRGRGRVNWRGRSRSRNRHGET